MSARIPMSLIARRYKRVRNKSAPIRDSTRYYWFNKLIPPIAKMLMEESGGDSFRLAGPCGIAARVWVEVYKGEQEVLSVAFCPGDLSKGELRVTNWEGTNGQTFEPNTIGAINFLDREEVPITDETTVSDILRYASYPAERQGRLNNRPK